MWGSVVFMMNEVMIGRAKKLVDDGDVEYVNTNGNTLNFQGKGHNVSKGEVYIITAEIQQNNEMAWSCSCHHAQFNDECKHMLACSMIIDNKELRTEYKIIVGDDDVVGSVELTIKSDDD